MFFCFAHCLHRRFWIEESRRDLGKTGREEKHLSKVCLDGKGIIIGAILINQVGDLGVLQGLIRERRDGEVVKSSSIWKSPISYGVVYKNILQGKL